MSLALLFLAISPCILVPFVVNPGFAPSLAAPRLRRLCAEFLAISGAALSLAFAFFLGDLPWLLTTAAILVAAISAVCCVLAAAALAIRSIFPSQSEKATTREVAANDGCGGNLSTVDPL